MASAAIQGTEPDRLQNGDPSSFVKGDTWDEASDLYDSVIGRVTESAASRLVELAHKQLPLSYDAIPQDSSLPPKPRLIDLGAGTGSLTLALTEQFPELDVLATDISPAMLEQLEVKWGEQTISPERKSTPSAARKPIQTRVVDIQAPFDGHLDPSEKGTFSHATSLCALQMVPDSPGVVQNMYELLAPGGCCAIGTWCFHDGTNGLLDVWELACKAADPTYVQVHRLPDDRWGSLAELRAGMEAVGLENLVSEPIPCRVFFENGTESYMDWWFKSMNPWPAERLSHYHGDVDKLKAELRTVLNDKYDKGNNLYIDIDVVMGTKPA